MAYSLRNGKIYRMPTHFGHSLGPRQGPNGRRFACRDLRQSLLQTSYRVGACELEDLLPPGFALGARPHLALTFTEASEIEWLAGRGYSTFGVTIPARYCGKADRVDGDFMLVLWENLADPIITGREELGFSKLYCELPAFQHLEAFAECRASWDGHEFARLTLRGGEEIEADSLPPQESEGLLHYKYIPRTGAPGVADAEYATFTPARTPNARIEHVWRFDEIDFGFHHSRWEDLPTLAPIVNRLARIKLGECLGGFRIETRGGKDLSDQRILS